MKKLLFVFLFFPFFLNGQSITKFHSFDVGFVSNIVIKAEVMSNYETGEINKKYIVFTATEGSLSGVTESCVCTLDYSKIDEFHNVLKQFKFGLVSGIDKGISLQYVANDEITLFLSESFGNKKHIVSITLKDGLDRIIRVLNEKNIQEMMDMIAIAKTNLDSVQ